MANTKPIATTISERKDMDAEGQGGDTLSDLASLLDAGDMQGAMDYFEDEDPFLYL